MIKIIKNDDVFLTIDLVVLFSKIMKKNIFKFLLGLVSVVIAFAVVVQISFNNGKKQVYAAAPFSIKDFVSTADVNLGKRLYAVRSGCIDCHGADLSGSMVMDNGAMGSIYGANITPYQLSQWSDEEIARAIRYGIHQSGRSLQFMPSFDYETLSIGDIAALVAYLRSVPSVEKPSHENTFGPVAKVLSFSGKMPVMFPAKVLDLQRGFGEKPAEGPSREFGKYLANSCVGCHGSEFRGGKIPGGDPSWPEASNIRLGSNSIWTEAAFQEAIRSGVSPTSKQPLRLPMPVKLLQQLDETEIKALWEYLSTLK